MDSPEPEDLFEEDLNEDLVQQDEAEEVPETTEEPRVVKPKRDVKKQVLLTDTTLRGKRGLTSLPSYFERIKFKGKGHEEKDLGAILKTYEYWCYRLFPRRPFDVCVDRIEKLGSKKAVQTYIRRIRLDMVQEDEENLENNIINDPEDDIQIVHSNDLSDDDINQGAQTNNQFDQLIATRTDGGFKQLVNNTRLTVDQEELIRKNKEKAEQLRRERLQRQAHQSLIQSNAVVIANLSQDLFPDDTSEQLDILQESQASENPNHNVSLEQVAVSILASPQNVPPNELSQKSVNAEHVSSDSEEFNL